MLEDKLKSFLAGNPHYLGLFFALFGIAGLICAVTDSNWLFGDVSKVTYNLKKIDGWVNFFGRKTARFISGIISVIIILSGFFWFIAGLKRS
jgi:hypothetical protein